MLFRSVLHYKTVPKSETLLVPSFRLLRRVRLLPPLDPNEVVTIELDEEDESLEPEEFQILARFYNEEQEYAICTPVDPLLFFGIADEKDNVSLLSPEEAERIQPMLEDMLLDEI